jgi:hypothetical protein
MTTTHLLRHAPWSMRGHLAGMSCGATSRNRTSTVRRRRYSPRGSVVFSHLQCTHGHPSQVTCVSGVLVPHIGHRVACSCPPSATGVHTTTHNTHHIWGVENILFSHRSNGSLFKCLVMFCPALPVVRWQRENVRVFVCVCVCVCARARLRYGEVVSVAQCALSLAPRWPLA